MSYEPVKVGTVKEGRYIIDPNTEEVCQVINIDKSKPGKHGAAKARMVIMGLFDGKKREFVSGVDKRVNVPIIDKKNASVTNIEGETLSLMDGETYEMFEVNMPVDEALKEKVTSLFKAGKAIDIEYWIVMGRKKIHNVREGE